MAKYHYKQYLHRAFWNSLVAVLCALVVVLIIVYGWQGFKSVIDRVIPSNEELSKDGNEENDEMLLLESLRGESTLSEDEQDVLLQELKVEQGSDTEMSNAEREELLNSLRNDS